MKNKNTWLFILVLLFIVFWAGDKVYAQYYLWDHLLTVQIEDIKVKSPSSTNSKYQEIEPKNVSEIQEVAILKTDDLTTTILAISESPDQNRLFTVSSKGLLYAWDLKKNEITFETNVLFASTNGTTFSADGNWLLTPGKINPDNTISGYQIIKTADGNYGECKGSSLCTSDYTEHNIGQLFSPNAQIIISYDSYDAKLTPVLDLEENLNFSAQKRIGNCKYKSNYNLDIQKIAISPSQKYIGYIFETGEVCIQNFEDFSGINLEAGVELEDTKGASFDRIQFDITEGKEGRIKVGSFSFDPTNRWLAILTHKSIMVLDLKVGFLHPVKFIDDAISNGTTALFNRSGTILVIGSNNKLEFYGLTTGNKLAEFHTPHISSLYFTQDNRALIWGDDKGKIHIWSIR